MEENQGTRAEYKNTQTHILCHQKRAGNICLGTSWLAHAPAHMSLERGWYVACTHQFSESSTLSSKSKIILSILSNNFLQISSHLDHFLLKAVKPQRRQDGNSPQAGCVLQSAARPHPFGSSYDSHSYQSCLRLAYRGQHFLTQSHDPVLFLSCSAEEKMEPL